MVKYREMSKEVFYVDDSLVQVGKQELDFLKERVGNTPKKRIRLCAHRSKDDYVHEMIILLDKETYIRPAKHIGKAESLHVVEGRADAVFFDEIGKISKVIQMGDSSTGLKFYYRIDDPVYHALIVRSEYFIFHETTGGPFNRADTIFASWAPVEADLAAVREYMEKTRKIVVDTLQSQNYSA